MGVLAASGLSGCSSSHFATAPHKYAFPAVVASPPNIHVINFLSSHTGFAAVNDSLLGTTNGGASWHWHSLPHHESVVHMDFLTAQVGWVLAQGGNGSKAFTSLLHTTNGGQTWTVQRKFATNVVGNLAMTTATHGYVIADKHLYVISATHPQGTKVALPKGSVPQQLDFLTTQTGWVSVEMGSQYELLATTSGTQHFHPIFHSQSPIMALSFSTPQEGHLLLGQMPGVPNLGSLEVTYNGGKTWTQQVSPHGFLQQGASGFPADMSFKGSKDGWLATSSGALGIQSSGLLVTTDGGSRWTANGSKEHWNVEAQSMTSAGTGWVANNNALLFTQNNGQLWTQKWPALVPLQTDFVSAQTGYGLGTATDPKAILVTHNGGRTWNIINAHPPATFSTFSFWGSDGLAVWSGTNRHGTYLSQVFRTTDGGRTWTKVFSRPSFSARITRVGMNQATLRTSKAVYTTSDGGKQWTRVRNVTTHKPGQVTSYLSNSQRMEFYAGHGWGAPATLTWVNGHQRHRVYTWPTSSHTFYESSAVDFLSRRVGWVILQKMVRTPQTFRKPGSTKVFHKMRFVNQLYRTTDGGAHWAITNLPSSLSLNSHALEFVNPNVGFMEANWSVLRTTDGGRHWSLMSTAAPQIP